MSLFTHKFGIVKCSNRDDRIDYPIDFFYLKWHMWCIYEYIA